MNEVIIRVKASNVGTFVFYLSSKGLPLMTSFFRVFPPVLRGFHFMIFSFCSQVLKCFKAILVDTHSCWNYLIFFDIFWKVLFLGKIRFPCVNTLQNYFSVPILRRFLYLTSIDSKNLNLGDRISRGELFKKLLVFWICFACL